MKGSFNDILELYKIYNMLMNCLPYNEIFKTRETNSTIQSKRCGIFLIFTKSGCF